MRTTRGLFALRARHAYLRDVSSLAANESSIQEHIDTEKALIFSKTTCGFCARAKMCFEVEQEQVEGFAGAAMLCK